MQHRAPRKVLSMTWLIPAILISCGPLVIGCSVGSEDVATAQPASDDLASSLTAGASDRPGAMAAPSSGATYPSSTADVSGRLGATTAPSSGATYPTRMMPKALPPLTQPLPSYLTSQYNNNTGTYVTRITDAAALGASGTPVLRHAYAKIQPWNADGSLLLLGFAYPGHLLDGRTFKYLRRVNQPSDAVWSNTDPNRMYGVSSNALVSLDVRNNQSSVVRAFSSYSALRLGSGEGNLSNDDRRVVLFGHNAQGNIDVFVHDLATGSTTGTLSLPMAWSQVQSIDATMSQSGRYVVVGYAARGTGALQGKKVYDLQMNLLRTVSPGGGTHADVALDTSGNDVLVSADAPLGGNDRSFYSARLSDGTLTKVLDGSAIGWMTHISCRSIQRPGYCYVSTFFDNPASDYNWAPLYNQGFSIRLDGLLKIEPFAQLQHGANTAYSHQPHLSPNRDGSLVLWASNWNNAAADATVHTFIAGTRPLQ
jgi:hypothetical protein